MMSQPTTTSASVVDDVIITSELARRPSRLPDFEAENRSLVELAKAMAESPTTVFQKLAETARMLCQAGSGGVSVLEPEGKPSVFRWRGTAGAYACYLGSTLPRDFSPCGTVLDRNAAQLMADPVRFFPALAEMNEPVREVLLIPFSQGGKAVGTIWVVAHTLDHRFDTEDLRIVTNLTRFAEATVELASRIEMTIRAENEVRRSGEHARTILESINDAFCTFDRELRFTYVNHQAEILLGLERAELLGKTQWEIYPHTQATSLDGHYRQVLANGVAAHFENFDPVHDRWYELNVYPSPEGGLAVYFRDVSDRKRAEQALNASHEFNRILMDATADCVKVLDLDGCMLHMNVPGLCAMEIDHFDSICGQSWSKLWPRDVQLQLAEAVSTAVNGTVVNFEEFCPTANGNPRWWDVTVSPVRNSPDGPVVRLLAVSRDVSGKRKVEEEREQLVSQLQEQDRRKDEFLATLAHELRNPLAPIRNGLQVMKLARHDANAVEQSRSMMERQLGQMVHLIDDLLDVSRISRGKVQLRKERIDLAKVVQHAVETSRPLIDEQSHELTLDLPPEPIFLDADLIRLTQVFANLLNNAAKYTERGGLITLTVKQHDGKALVSVKDTGVGIPSPMLPKVFDIFTQIDRSFERSQGGLGIGLSLVKKLVEMHGGTVEARSDGHGEGSEFVVQLPIVQALTMKQEDAKADSDPARISFRRILVVDDNRDSALSLAMLLRIMGNETQTAYDGLEALDVAAAFKPDVILLDIGMPKLDGYETARRIRQEVWGTHVVLVAQTGWGQDDDRRRSQEEGFNFHMVKPIDPIALEKLLLNSAMNDE